TAPVARLVNRNGRRAGLSQMAATSPLALVKNWPGPRRNGMSSGRCQIAPISPLAFVNTRLPPAAGLNVEPGRGANGCVTNPVFASAGVPGLIASVPSPLVVSRGGLGGLETGTAATPLVAIAPDPRSTPTLPSAL